METKIILFLIVASLATLLITSCSKQRNLRKQEHSAKTKLVEDSIKKLVRSNSATIVDVRTPEEFAEGHIEHSVNIPLDIVKDSIHLFKNYENIVVVCRSGGRSTKAQKILRNNGYQNTYNGMAWTHLDSLLRIK